MNYVNSESYMVIQGWMLTELGLKGSELMAYAIIYGYSQDGESEFSGSLKYLAEWTGACKNTVIKALASLEEKGLIRKRRVVVNGVTLCRYAALPDALPDLVRGCKNCTGGGAKTAPNTIDNNLVNTPLPPKGKTPRAAVTGEEERERLEGAALPQAVAEQLAAWLQYKRERREGYTPTGLKSLLTEVQKRAAVSGAEAVAGLIRQSMAAGWRGICWDKLPGAPPGVAPEPASPPAYKAPKDWLEAHGYGRGG